MQANNSLQAILLRINKKEPAHSDLSCHHCCICSTGLTCELGQSWPHTRNWGWTRPHANEAPSLLTGHYMVPRTNVSDHSHLRVGCPISLGADAALQWAPESTGLLLFLKSLCSLQIKEMGKNIFKKRGTGKAFYAYTSVKSNRKSQTNVRCEEDRWQDNAMTTVFTKSFSQEYSTLVPRWLTKSSNWWDLTYQSCN